MQFINTSFIFNFFLCIIFFPLKFSFFIIKSLTNLFIFLTKTSFTNSVLIFVPITLYSFDLIFNNFFFIKYNFLRLLSKVKSFFFNTVFFLKEGLEMQINSLVKFS